MRDVLPTLPTQPTPSLQGIDVNTQAPVEVQVSVGVAQKPHKDIHCDPQHFNSICPCQWVATCKSLSLRLWLNYSDECKQQLQGGARTQSGGVQVITRACSGLDLQKEVGGSNATVVHRACVGVHMAEQLISSSWIVTVDYQAT